VLKDPLRLDAETQYLAHHEYCLGVQQHQHYHELRNDARDSNYVLRKELYQRLGNELIPMLYKNHGFETLKTHLACQTGIYNQFNLLYREPLVQHIKQHAWFGVFSARIKHSGDARELLDFHNRLCEQPDMISANVYRLDF
jgi:hypothetical protein